MARQLGDLEAAVMDLLWGREEWLSVRDVLDALTGERQLAYTTVMTVLDNLHRKGLLTRTQHGRAYRYRPARGRADFAADLVATALEGNNDKAAVLLRFVEQLDAREVARLRASLDRLGSPQDLPEQERPR